MRLSERLAWLQRIDRAALRGRAPIIGAIVAGLIVLHLCGWLWLAHAARARVEAYVAAHGDTIASRSIGSGGYPFHVEARLTGVVLTVRTGSSMRLEAPLVTVRLGLPAFHGISVTTPEGSTLTLGGQRVEARVAKLRLSGTSENGRIAQALLTIGGLTFPTAVSGPRVDSVKLLLTLPPAPASTATGESGHFTLDVSNVVMPGDFGALGATIGHIQFDGVANGALPAIAPDRDALAAWRDSGGTIDLRRAALDWNKFQVAGEGTLTLDKSLQPEAAFSANVDGWPDLLDALAASGALKLEQARIIKFGLTLLSSPSADGSMKLPITIQHSELYLEKAKILELPRIDWPEA
jgi:hypothetical protein